MDSEYLVTLLVVVPLVLQPDWNNRVSISNSMLLLYNIDNLNVVVQPDEHLNVVVQPGENLKQLA